jgi:tetratricopeptide (TPR) repeat protein
LQSSGKIGSRWTLVNLVLPLLVALASAPVGAQNPIAQIEGLVRDSTGRPIAGVSVSLQRQGDSDLVQFRTDEAGVFRFASLAVGNYTVKLQKAGYQEAIEDFITLSPSEKRHCEFVLQISKTTESSADPSLRTTIELDDRPNFTVAGITDSTGSGGHAAETRLRTGEALAQETVNLKADALKSAAPDSTSSESESRLRISLQQNPRGFEANHRLGELYFHSQRYRQAVPLLEAAYQANPQDHTNAFDLLSAMKDAGDLAPARERLHQILANGKQLGKAGEADFHRLLGDVDEKLGDPLAAEKEYERSAGLDPSEPNYFAWGTELLLHGAAAPATEVFQKGVRMYSHSSRMLSGLGAALFMSGSAPEAAQRLCQASDVEPASGAPYLFLGKMQEATSTPLLCAEQKLARFAETQPENALANYYYALALWKQNRGSQNPEAVEHARSLFRKASAIDPKLDVAYLQLGNMEFALGSAPDAISAYQRAIAANPESSEAHYRLGLAYKTTGDGIRAQREFDLYKQLDKSEAEKVERQRRDLRQFLFVLKDQPADSHSSSNSTSPYGAKPPDSQ